MHAWVPVDWGGSAEGFSFSFPFFFLRRNEAGISQMMSGSSFLFPIPCLVDRFLFYNE